MMYGLSVHHVQVAVKDGAAFISKLVHQVGFRLASEKRTNVSNHWVLTNGGAFFLVTELTGERKSIENSNADGNIPMSCISPLFLNKDDSGVVVDTVYNVAFKVSDVQKTLFKAKSEGASIVCESTVVKDAHGEVVVGVVKSCLGNILHTVIDDSKYSGLFLPGFTNAIQSLCSSQNNTSLVSHFDHVTYACDSDSMDDVIRWYQKCFGMKRFKINRNDDDLDGMVINGASSGLRLKAMDYWKCSEEGLMLNLDSLSGTAIILAEGIKGSEPNQIDTFLQEHNGAGIQHIGLYTPDIFKATRAFMNEGLGFMTPPMEYYSELGKVNEIICTIGDVSLLSSLNILLDTEEDWDTKHEGNAFSKPSKRYLMQVFSKPVFDKNTFFLELIQREGARGFGAGNIKALWQAVAAHMTKEELKPFVKR